MASVVTSVAATLKGKVIDESTQQPLIGATILIKGTAQGVTTNLDGEFELKVDRKPHTIAVSYISYVTQEVLLEGKGDNKLDILVQLASDTKVMEAVKVTAKLNRESEYAAIADQKDAIFATQVVGAKELSRKGVSDAQGAVAKVSGISKQEGVKNVIVRGLGDRYNATTLNGFPIPSEDPEYKNISLDFFSTDIIQSVIVNKTFTAVGSSDVGGANINITSKELTGDSKFDVSVSGGINTNTVGKDVLVPDGINSLGFASTKQPTNVSSEYNFENSLDPEVKGSNMDKSIALSGGKKFMIGENPLNVYLVASYDNSSNYREEEIRDVNTAGQLGREQYVNFSDVSTSYLGLANVNYTISDKHRLDYNLMYIRSGSSSVGEYFGMDQSSQKFAANSDDMGYTRRQQINENSLMVNQIISKWDLSSRVDLEVGASYNMIKGNEPDRRIDNYALVDEATNTYKPSTAGGNHMRTFSELTDNDFNIKVAVAYKLSSDEANKSLLKVGYNGRIVDNNFEETEYNYQLSQSPEVTINNFAMDDFFNSANLSSGAFYNYGNIKNTYTVAKSIHSLFADVTYQFSDALIASLGLKYDIVNVEVDAETGDTGYGGQVVNPDALEKGYFLPSLNLRYALDEKNALRLSLSKTYTLPQSKELAPYIYYGPSFTSQGNANLQPSENYNFDLKWDWYMSNSELLTVTGFYKLIMDPIARTTTQSAGGFLTYNNIADQATAAGLEVEFRKNLLTNKISDDSTNKLSMGFNGSYIYTNVEMDSKFVPKNESSQLQGAAPYIANVDVTYQMTRKRYDLLNTLVFNYTGDSVYAQGVNGFEDTIQEGIATLNFVSSVAFNNMKVSLKVNNILNSDYVLSRDADDGKNYILGKYNQGMDISLGFSYGF